MSLMQVLLICTALTVLFWLRIQMLTVLKIDITKVR